MTSMSFSVRPRLVIAGVPMRTPPGFMADTSPTTAFLFRVMWQASQADCRGQGEREPCLCEHSVSKHKAYYTD
jgi:hypothetical protein